MNFKSFILEDGGTPLPNDELSIDNITNYIKKNCWLWVSEMKRNQFYRGTKHQFLFHEFVPRTDRKPTDIPLALSIVMDQWFEKKFGWKPRSQGVFCTPRSDTADFYGKPYLFIPVGRYRYIWSNDAHDLYSSLIHSENIFSNTYYENNKGKIDSLELKHFKDLSEHDLNIPEIYNTLDSMRYTNRGAAKNDNNEMMVQCSKYVMIHTDKGWDALEKLGIKG